MKETVILGNIITVDDKRPFAKAALVKDGLFAYIGDAQEAKKLAGADATFLDYGDNFIYPGFLESHCHVKQKAFGVVQLAVAGKLPAALILRPQLASRKDLFCVSVFSIPFFYEDPFQISHR